jgi:hypothetical protein
MEVISTVEQDVSTRSDLLIAGEVSPVPISLYVTMNKFKEVEWAQAKDNIVLTQKTGTNMYKQVRS